jgi:hypothetical protein
MVEDRLTDGRRIAELLASELDGLGGALAAVAVVDADRDAEATPDGAYAYRVVRRGGDGHPPGEGDEDGAGNGNGDETGNGDHNRKGDQNGAGDGVREPDQNRELAEVFVHPDRARVEFVAGQEAAAEAAAAEDTGLRVRPKAVYPPRTLVFVEDGAAVKRAVTVFEAVVAAVGGADRTGTGPGTGDGG